MCFEEISDNDLVVQLGCMSLVLRDFVARGLAVSELS